jgi:hypothetical protein
MCAQDNDPVIVQHAACMVYELSKRESARHAIMSSAELINAVIVAMANTRDADTAKYTAGTLYNVSNHEQVCDRVLGVMH